MTTMTDERLDEIRDLLSTPLPDAEEEMRMLYGPPPWDYQQGARIEAEHGHGLHLPCDIENCRYWQARATEIAVAASDLLDEVDRLRDQREALEGRLVEHLDHV